MQFVEANDIETEPLKNNWLVDLLVSAQFKDIKTRDEYFGTMTIVAVDAKRTFMCGYDPTLLIGLHAEVNQDIAVVSVTMLGETMAFGNVPKSIKTMSISSEDGRRYVLKFYSELSRILSTFGISLDQLFASEKSTAQVIVRKPQQ